MTESSAHSRTQQDMKPYEHTKPDNRHSHMPVKECVVSIKQVAGNATEIDWR